MFDLAHFTLRDMTVLGSALRRSGEGAHSMEEVAGRVVRSLYEELVDPSTVEPACGLVRFFKTHDYGDLGEDLRRFAEGQLTDPAAASPGLKCLTLLATAGEKHDWNARERSVAHRAIPLESREIANRTPMITRLLSDLGVEIEELLERPPEMLVEPEPSSFNVFYVPEARGHSYIPAQEEFVLAVGIASVLGFGGMLPSGNIFAVILFSKVPISRDTAGLFRTLALNVKTAALPFDHAVFADSTAEGPA